MNRQTQIRLPEDLKGQFRNLCKEHNTTMTTEICRFIRTYIQSNVSDRQIATSLDELDMTRRTGLVRDHRGIWVPRDQLETNNEWNW